jgi:hypothetical protein
LLRRVTEQHAVRQIALLAAGLDTRAFRLSRPAQLVRDRAQRAVAEEPYRLASRPTAFTRKRTALEGR